MDVSRVSSGGEASLRISAQSSDEGKGKQETKKEMLGPDEQRANCAGSPKDICPKATSEKARGRDFEPLKVKVEKVDPSLSPAVEIKEENVYEGVINYQPEGNGAASPPMPVIENAFSLAPLIDAHVSQIPVGKNFLELHYSFCMLMYELVSASSEQELKNWHSQQEIGPVSSSSKVQNVACLLGGNAREVWINEEMKSTLSDVLLSLKEYTDMKLFPFPHIKLPEGVFIPMLVVKKVLFPMVRGSSVDKVLKEHNVEPRPTTNSERRHLIQLRSSKLGWVMSLRELLDIYADVVNVLYYTIVCKHLKSTSSDVQRSVQDSGSQNKVTPQRSQDEEAQPKQRVQHQSQAEAKHTCDQCGKTFSRSGDLSLHVLMHRGMKAHRCDKCGKAYTKKSHLNRHQITHSGSKPFSCDQCGKDFALKENLMTHQLVHSGEKPHTCDECGERFSQSGNLRRHVLIHCGVKAHRCDQCGKAFALRSNLTRHMQTHSRAELYRCDHCGKIYKNKQILIIHLRSHTGHEVCPCDQCDDVFTTYRDLERHQISHSSERPHKCDTCGKSFKWKSNLNRHQRVHEKNVFRCDECGKTFNTSSVLHSHLCVDGDMEQEPSSHPSDTRVVTTPSGSSVALKNLEIRLHRIPTNLLSAGKWTPTVQEVVDL